MMFENVLRRIVLGGIFALPFIVFLIANSLFFPFITGKNFTFRIIVEVVTGAYLALALINPEYRPRRSWLLGTFSLFVVIVAIADAFGVYPFKSIWSNFERMDGWVTLVHLFFLFVVASSVLNTEGLWRRFWHTSLAVSVLVGLYGLLQLLGVTSLNPGFSSAARIDATLGNPIYLAVFMLFHIGIAAVLLAQAWVNAPRSRAVVSVFYGGVIAFDTLVLLLTSTRGTILGLIVGALIAAFLLAIASPGARRKALVFIIGFFMLGGVFLLVRDQAWVERVPFLERLATISLDDSTTKARFYNWGMAWEGVKERPLLGWGQENYAVVFDKYYDPRMYGQEQWFDRVHNVVFDWLVAAGFFGLLSYLSIIGAALYLLWRRGEKNTFSVAERSVLTGLLAAYFFHNLFVFDNITSYVLFVSILAYIAWRGSENAPSIALPQVSRNLTPLVVVVAVVAVWGGAWFVNAKALAANRALLQALAPQEEGIQKNLENFKQSISHGSFGTQEAREQLAQAAAQVIRIEGISAELKRDFLETAVQEMSLMAEAAPLNARFPLFLGALLRESGNYDRAIAALERAHELSPGKQTILFELAATLQAKGDAAGALARYKEAYELEPDFTTAGILYAAAAIRIGESALADELLVSLAAKNSAADPRIAAAYVSRGRYDKVAEIWEEHIEKNPTNAQAYFTLAAAYYEAGNSTRAIEVLRELGVAAPGAKAQADTLIEQIRSGTAEILR